VLVPAAGPSIDSAHTVRSIAIVAGFGLIVALGVPWMLDAQVRRHLAAGGAAGYPAGEEAWDLDADTTRDDLPVQ
jgi:hypothetical protein